MEKQWRSPSIICNSQPASLSSANTHCLGKRSSLLKVLWPLWNPTQHNLWAGTKGIRLQTACLWHGCIRPLHTRYGAWRTANWATCLTFPERKKKSQPGLRVPYIIAKKYSKICFWKTRGKKYVMQLENFNTYLISTSGMTTLQTWRHVPSSPGVSTIYYKLHRGQKGQQTTP